MWFADAGPEINFLVLNSMSAMSVRKHNFDISLINVSWDLYSSPDFLETCILSFSPLVYIRVLGETIPSLRKLVLFSQMTWRFPGVKNSHLFSWIFQIFWSYIFRISEGNDKAYQKCSLYMFFLEALTLLCKWYSANWNYISAILVIRGIELDFLLINVRPDQCILLIISGLKLNPPNREKIKVL